jgi:hypothetical protein
MRALRPRLIGIALALLLLQSAGVAAVAVACCEAAPRASAAMPCCGKGDSGHICPIGKRADSTPRCRLTSDCDRSGDRGLGAAMFLLSSPPASLVTVTQPPVRATHVSTWEASPLEEASPPPTRPPEL